MINFGFTGDCRVLDTLSSDPKTSEENAFQLDLYAFQFHGKFKTSFSGMFCAPCLQSREALDCRYAFWSMGQGNPVITKQQYKLEPSLVGFLGIAAWRIGGPVCFLSAGLGLMELDFCTSRAIAKRMQRSPRYEVLHWLFRTSEGQIAVYQPMLGLAILQGILAADMAITCLLVTVRVESPSVLFHSYSEKPLRSDLGEAFQRADARCSLQQAPESLDADVVEKIEYALDIGRVEDWRQELSCSFLRAG
ncbi:unnamed protein product, partial [Symbiodinium sp. KB8]